MVEKTINTIHQFLEAIAIPGRDVGLCLKCICMARPNSGAKQTLTIRGKQLLCAMARNPLCFLIASPNARTLCHMDQFLTTSTWSANGLHPARGEVLQSENLGRRISPQKAWKAISGKTAQGKSKKEPQIPIRSSLSTHAKFGRGLRRGLYIAPA